MQYSSLFWLRDYSYFLRSILTIYLTLVQTLCNAREVSQRNQDRILEVQTWGTHGNRGMQGRMGKQIQPCTTAQSSKQEAAQVNRKISIFRAEDVARGQGMC